MLRLSLSGPETFVFFVSLWLVLRRFALSLLSRFRVKKGDRAFRRAGAGAGERSMITAGNLYRDTFGILKLKRGPEEEIAVRPMRAFPLSDAEHFVALLDGDGNEV